MCARSLYPTSCGVRCIQPAVEISRAGSATRSGFGYQDLFCRELKSSPSSQNRLRPELRRAEWPALSKALYNLSLKPAIPLICCDLQRRLPPSTTSFFCSLNISVDSRNHLEVLSDMNDFVLNKVETRYDWMNRGLLRATAVKTV